MRMTAFRACWRTAPSTRPRSCPTFTRPARGKRRRPAHATQVSRLRPPASATPRHRRRLLHTLALVRWSSKARALSGCTDAMEGALSHVMGMNRVAAAMHRTVLVDSVHRWISAPPFAAGTAWAMLAHSEFPCVPDVASALGARTPSDRSRVSAGRWVVPSGARWSPQRLILCRSLAPDAGRGPEPPGYLDRPGTLFAGFAPGRGGDATGRWHRGDRLPRSLHRHADPGTAALERRSGADAAARGCPAESLDAGGRRAKRWRADGLALGRARCERQSGRRAGRPGLPGPGGRPRGDAAGPHHR